MRNEQTKHLEDSELVVYLKSKLNRPIRVCGVVKNEGEPGGGPYIAYNPDGTASFVTLKIIKVISLILLNMLTKTPVLFLKNQNREENCEHLNCRGYGMER